MEWSLEFILEWSLESLLESILEWFFFKFFSKMHVVSFPKIVIIIFCLLKVLFDGLTTIKSMAEVNKGGGGGGGGGCCWGKIRIITIKNHQTRAQTIV